MLGHAPKNADTFIFPLNSAIYSEMQSQEL